MQNKIWTEESIVELLIKSDRAVERGILAIYALQTESEKNSQTTNQHNNIGFSGADASSGSYYAEWLNSGNKLTGKHLDKARKMVIKYSKQLLQIVNTKTQKEEI